MDLHDKHNPKNRMTGLALSWRDGKTMRLQAEDSGWVVAHLEQLLLEQTARQLAHSRMWGTRWRRCLNYLVLAWRALWPE